MLLTLLLVEHDFLRFYTVCEQTNTDNKTPEVFNLRGFERRSRDLNPGCHH